MPGRYDPNQVNKHKDVNEKVKDVYKGFWITIVIIVVVAIVSLIK